MKTNKILGVLLNYTLAVVDVLVALFFIPFLLSKLGDSNYGVYKLMQSTASYLSVLDFGIGSTITRYIVKYKVEKKDKKQENFLAMALLIYAVLALSIVFISIVIMIAIPSIYSKSLDPTVYSEAQKVFLVICMTTAVSLFNHAYNGLMVAYEKFALSSGLSIIKIILRVGMIIVGLNIFNSPLTIVIVDFIAELLLLTTSILYARISLNCRPKLYSWDWPLAREAFVFTLAIFVQSIINQFNTNLDNIVLGIYTTTAVISMYSIVLQIYTLYSTIATSISTVYLPSISSKVFEKKSDEEITDSIIFPSRIQLILLLLVFVGFILLGRDFISLWLNRDGYQDVYVLTCILLGASTLELSQTTITSVLKAKNILRGRSIILSVSTVINAIITVLLVPKFGALGAVLGTAFSLVFGYGIALSVYYKKAAHLNMKRFYYKVYFPTVPVALVALAVGYFIINQMKMYGIIGFLLKGFVVLIIYCVFVFLFVLNDSEKRSILGRISNG